MSKEATGKADDASGESSVSAVGVAEVVGDAVAPTVSPEADGAADEVPPPQAAMINAIGISSSAPARPVERIVVMSMVPQFAGQSAGSTMMRPGTG
jgi:hypothetical protein